MTHSLPVRCVVVLLALLCCVPWTQAATFRSGEEVVVAQDEVIADDLYVAGDKIRILGTVEGDVIGFGNQVEIGGTVEGTLAVGGQTVLVTGKVANSARLGGQVIKLAGGADVGGDLMAGGFSLECEPESRVGRDLFFGGYQMLLTGQVDRNVVAGSAAAELRGQVQGDVYLEVGAGNNEGPPPYFGPPPPVAYPQVATGVTVGQSARIGGNFSYSSPDEGRISPDAQVAGETSHSRPAVAAAAAAPPRNPWWAAARRGISLLVVGLLLVAVCPRWTLGVADQVRQKPLASLGWGAVMLALLLVAFVLLFLATILGSVLAGLVSLGDLVPVVLVVGSLSVLVLLGFGWLYTAYLAQVVVGVTAGRTIFRQSAATATPLVGRVLALVVGLLLLVALSHIPVAGFILGLVVVLLGLGGLWNWCQARRMTAAEPKTVAT